MIGVKEVIVLLEATTDLEAGREFYESTAAGVGQYFIDSIISDLNSLKLQAGVHRKVSGLHRMLSKRFPFAIYYDIENEFARVAAILDMRRDPAWIRNELEGRSS